MSVIAIHSDGICSPLQGKAAMSWCQGEPAPSASGSWKNVRSYQYCRRRAPITAATTGATPESVKNARTSGSSRHSQRMVSRPRAWLYSAST